MVFTKQRLKTRPLRFKIGHIQQHCRQRPARDTIAATAAPLVTKATARNSKLRPPLGSTTSSLRPQSVAVVWHRSEGTVAIWRQRIPSRRILVLEADLRLEVERRLIGKHELAVDVLHTRAEWRAAWRVADREKQLTA
jgi:hypothetical protein